MILSRFVELSVSLILKSSPLQFDGLEGHSATGPPGIAEAMLHQAFFDNLQREALVESSSGGGFLWHLNTRTGQTDWAATDRRAYMDYSKGPDMLSAKCNSLDTPDIGWWGFEDFVPGSFYATLPDGKSCSSSRLSQTLNGAAAQNASTWRRERWAGTQARTSRHPPPG